MRRRDQNRISQRAFRRRKEEYALELESKVKELEDLLEAVGHENSEAASRMNKMEGELLYYRGLLYGAASQGNSFTSYLSSEYQPDRTREDIAVYSTVPVYSGAPSMQLLVAPALANEYWRVGSYDSPSTGSYSPIGNTPLEYPGIAADRRLSMPERSTDTSIWTSLQFSTFESG
ncbi:hypothetical protein OIDMADRAFT_35847 [Oidiodendron maius Zn]|uniref:BZIP domain-containing protein n=1 Tax=Oidiodendron maius (strain Zn) TaxID=913774 RepID=A0A0C3C378_OIDMZ|nr:hypothetical protein OIDMADRAFT_35847 [Oidiodendron maius Zn]